MINPSFDQLKDSTLNMVVAGNDLNKLLMIDMDGKEIKLDVLSECFCQGFVEIKKIIDGIKRLAKLINNPKFEVIFKIFYK